MAVTRQKNKKWKVDLSDGYDAITGGQKRHRKQISNHVKKLNVMKLITVSINFIKWDTKTKSL